MSNTTWTINGADGPPIIGNTHEPDGDARGVLIIAHGFKGYKDYGFMPLLAQDAAKAGLVAHRFNFSHSGMTDKIDSFERPDLFERDTWSKQVHDLLAVHRAVQDGELAGKGLPIIWFGHSRGGATCILAAARTGEDGPVGIVPASAPDSCDRFDDQTRAVMKQDGYVVSPSARTGQQLRIGRQWLDEIEADPDAHDPIKAMASLACPILLVHGDEDPTVPVSAARTLAAANERAKTHIIEGAQHTFNCPNPLEGAPPAATREMVDAVCAFATSCC